MSRITRDEYLMEAALLVAKRSTCLRLQVGSVLAREGRIIVSGYNGAPSGMEHCTPLTCGPKIPCTRTVHAEANCVYFAARYGIATQGTTLYTTDSPCPKCCEAVINAGIERVVYTRPYRDSPLETLKFAGVYVDLYNAPQP